MLFRSGCFYAQYFLFVDSGIAYGTWISIQALLTPIIGGVGTVFGPLLGALVVKSLGECAKLLAGDAPGLDLIIYGAVLVLVIWFVPRGLIGGLANLRDVLLRGRRSAASSTGEARHESFVVHAAESESHQGYTPFEGKELSGRVKSTFLRGDLIYDKGSVAGPARGKYLRRSEATAK